MRKSKDRQHNCQKTNNDLQNTTQKTKYRATRIPLKTGSVKVDRYCRIIETYYLFKCIFAVRKPKTNQNRRQL